jgi:hypothetical protein
MLYVFIVTSPLNFLLDVSVIRYQTYDHLFKGLKSLNNLNNLLLVNLIIFSEFKPNIICFDFIITI